MENWHKPFEILRRKWQIVPSGNDLRQSSTELLRESDTNLLAHWERAKAFDTEGEGFGVRGWYHNLYRAFMPGKKVLDIGCGMAISTLCFAEMGAVLTFVDIVAENVQLVERLCKLKGITAQFMYMENVDSLRTLDKDYDVVTAIGSLINAPLEVVKSEVDELKCHLKAGGRWLHLAYPKSRWLRDGSPPPKKWAEMTDGPGTPWMEWHDKEKLQFLFEPSQIRFLFDCKWHNQDFNWFDIELLAH